MEGIRLLGLLNKGPYLASMTVGTVLMSVFLSPWALAQETHSASQTIEEAFQTELVFPQEKSEVQLTLAPAYTRGAESTGFRLGMFLEYGLTDKWQIQAEWTPYNSRRFLGTPVVRGTGNVSLGTQYSFMNVAGSNTHAAAGFETTLPIGDREKHLDEGNIEYEPYIAIARDFFTFRQLQIFSSLGLGLVQKRHIDDDEDGNEPAAHELSWNSGFSFVASKPAVLVGEFSWNSNRWNNDGDERSFYVTPGVVLRLGEWQLGIGTPWGIGAGATKFQTIFKLTHEFSLGGKEE